MKHEPNISNEEVELIHKAQQGDQRAFTELVKKYESTIYSFAFKVCRDEEKASETMQDTFINVFRKLKQYKGDAQFSTWLYQIVTNNCLMKRRKNKLDRHSVSLGLPDDSSSDSQSEEILQPIHTIPLQITPQDEVVNNELRERLDQAILKLPMEQRIVFILRDVEGRSSEETAKILKISVAAAKSRLRRARMVLQEQLREYVTP
ncbi:MAG TPA: sigma-70 family RNA polymerase sigma factor [Bacteroidota bacterium]|nr:sigma-70 family RNA polymerase sigma factor [Bacteroidota bacterium]